LADWRGDDFYYTHEDLEWEVEPTDLDPGITTPKSGAIPRDIDGHPMIPPPAPGEPPNAALSPEDIAWLQDRDPEDEDPDDPRYP
jgi:hypothetical protein